MEQINKSFEIMQTAYNESVNFFAEDVKTTQPEDFFGVVFNFAQAIQVHFDNILVSKPLTPFQKEAVKLNELAILNAEKMKRREDAKLKRARYYTICLNLFLLKGGRNECKETSAGNSRARFGCR